MLVFEIIDLPVMYMLIPSEVEETPQFNRLVLMEVVRVLESPKFQKMELAQKVRKMMSQNTLPTVCDEYLEVNNTHLTM